MPKETGFLCNVQRFLRTGFLLMQARAQRPGDQGQPGVRLAQPDVPRAHVGDPLGGQGIAQPADKGGKGGAAIAPTGQSIERGARANGVQCVLEIKARVQRQD